MAYGLGVDLGTTFTAAAVVRDGRVEMASLGDRSTAMPSVVFMRPEGGVLTGDAADRRASSEPDRVAREVKRRLGDPTPLLLGGTPYSAGDLLATQLREVVAQISEREGGAPTAVRLTHPANWGDYKRELFAQVPRLAGLHDVTMITEPEAAAAHYATNERIGEGRTVAVYDLGGGTFDATVLRTTGGGFEILGEPEGVEGLGGIDFDEAVYAHVDRCLDGAVSALDPTDASATSGIVRLRRDCVLAKEALSSDTETTVPVLLPELQTEVRLTRGEFEEMIRPSVVATITALGRALDSARVEPDQLDAVLLVGGSSRIPLVARMVSAELGKPTAVDAHPKHAIVLGAAMLVEPPSRATGPGAASPAHTAVFPTSGAPYRTPVPPVGPRTPPGGVPTGGGSGRSSTGPSSGLIPVTTMSGAPRTASRPATGGFPVSGRTGPHGRGGAGGSPGPAGSAGPRTGTGPTRAVPGHDPRVPMNAGSTGRVPYPAAASGHDPRTTMAPGSRDARTTAVGGHDPRTTVVGGQDARTTAVGPGAPPEAAPVGGSSEPGGRRRPLVLVGLVLVALLIGGGALVYTTVGSQSTTPPVPAPSQVVAPTPLPTTAPAADPNAGGSGGTGGSGGSGSGGGSAGGSGSGGGSGAGGTGGRGGGSGSGGGSGGGGGHSTWTPPTTHDPGGTSSTDGDSTGSTDGGSGTGGTDGTGCC
ncbi:Hsp70 family protein [Actinomycetospora aeridis]|uniref:Hsp70 family protein n=1 Tax=Actinomycetospora aeridis TaxID=3129231 RepID=A0ABU8N1Q5_9PSEU